MIDNAAQVLDTMSIPNMDEMVTMMEQLYTPLNFSLITMFLNVCIIGVVVSLITAAFVYQKPSLFDRKQEEEW